jgi:hypothetical protein
MELREIREGLACGLLRPGFTLSTLSHLHTKATYVQ